MELLFIILIIMFLHEKFRDIFPTPEQRRIAQEHREINRKMDEIRQKTYDKFHPDGK